MRILKQVLKVCFWIAAFIAIGILIVLFLTIEANAQEYGPDCTDCICLMRAPTVDNSTPPRNLTSTYTMSCEFWVGNARYSLSGNVPTNGLCFVCVCEYVMIV